MLRRPVRTLASIALALAAISTADAQVLTYGGDGDRSSSNASWTNNPTNTLNQIIFDNFSVGSGLQWTVTGVFGTLSNGGYTPLVSVLNWEIRQGMVQGGSTGSVIVAGSGGFSVNGNVHTVAANPFTLDAGTYWLGIWADLTGTTPDDVNNGTYFGVEQTSGTNSVNALLDAQAIWLVGADGSNVGGTSNAVDQDFSYGVLGRSAPIGTVVPEPASVALVGGGLLALGVVMRRRRQGSR